VYKFEQFLRLIDVEDNISHDDLKDVEEDVVLLGGCGIEHLGFEQGYVTLNV